MKQSIDVKRSDRNQLKSLLRHDNVSIGLAWGLTHFKGCSGAAVRHKCQKATQGMFSITCPWLSSHHVTLSRRLREPSIDLGLNKLIVKFPGFSNQYVQLHTSQNTRRIRNENKRTAAARRWGGGRRRTGFCRLRNFWMVP